MSQLQLQARITVPTGGAGFEVTRDGYATRSCTIPAGDYYLTDAGDSDDILDAINTAMANGGGELGSQYDLGLTDYEVTADNVTGGDDVSWDFSTSTAARAVADAIGIDETFDVSSGSSSSSETGGILPPALWRPDVITAAVSDFPVDDVQLSQAQSQDRTVIETLVYSVARGWRLRFRCMGSPLEAVENEYHWLRRFWLFISYGRAFRYYRDETSSTAYNVNRIGSGYSTLMLDAQFAGWDLQPIGGNFMRQWEIDALAWEVA